MSVWVRSLSAPIPEFVRKNLRRASGEQPSGLKSEIWRPVLITQKSMAQALMDNSSLLFNRG